MPFSLTVQTMAVALEKLEDQLNCSICLETYINPKQLQCHHIFCQKCLIRLVIRDQQGQLSLPCPSCRQATPVPANGVAGLQAAFQINKFIEIVEEHKKALVDAVGNKAQSVSASLTSVVCPEHDGKEVDLYCETCGETICWKCIKRDGKHHSHCYEELNEAFEIYRREIVTFLEPMKNQLIIFEEALAQLNARDEEISVQQRTIESDIDNTIEQLHEALNTRKTELVNQLDQLTQAKLKSIAVQRDQIETTQAQMNSCLQFIWENLKTSSQGEVLRMKSTTVRQVKELTATFQPDILEPNAKADMIFSGLADLTVTKCQNYGTIYSAGSPDPSKCLATGQGTDTATVGEKSTAVLKTVNFNSQPCKTPMSAILCELVSEITGTREKGNVQGNKEGQYEISYQPTIKGRH